MNTRPDYDVDGCRHLLAAIFLLAWRDLHCGLRCLRNDARLFFASDGAVQLAALMDISLDDIQATVRKREI
jgi:hypothetical protein